MRVATPVAMADGATVTLGFLVLTTTLTAISVIDFRTRRIPDWLSLPLIVAGLLWSHQWGDLPFADYLIGVGVGFASLGVFGSIYFRIRGHEGLGLGDAKLFAAAGAWLGWQALPLVLLVASLGGLAYGLIVRAFSKGQTGPQIAFGPWIAAAIWLAWLASTTMR